MKGISEELQKISPIVGYGGKYQLEFLEGITLEDPELPYEEMRKRELTYASPLKVPVRLISVETGEVQEQEVFMSDIPLMTNSGTFLVNGTERVIVSQFIRSLVFILERKHLTFLAFKILLPQLFLQKVLGLKLKLTVSNYFMLILIKLRRFL